MRMLLETLANELLFQVFEYLSSVDLFHAFNGLNSRFDGLIIEYFRKLRHIDFRLMLKEDVAMIRRRYLQSFIDRIQSICISDETTTPHEIDLFISRINPLYRFQYLKSIALFNVCSLDKINRILHDLNNISTLTSLSMKHCHTAYDPKNVVTMMDSIWTLSSLTYCCLEISFDDISHLIVPSVISCSLKHLSISGFQCDLDSLSCLYDHTPCVEHLSITLCDPYEDYEQLLLLHSITSLNIKCENSSRIIETLLRKTPNLTELTIETRTSMDGYLWKNVINKYLSKLRTFNLRMEIRLMDNDHVEEAMDQVVDTFRDPFWIDQHRWFVRCFLCSENDRSSLHLHTIPFVFDSFSMTSEENILFRSTCPRDKYGFEYNYVQEFKYNCALSKDLNLPCVTFPNIRTLTLTLPYSDHLQLLVPHFTHLVSLKLKMVNLNHHDNDLSQVQVLLDQAPKLFYLKFDSWISAASKFETTNKKNPTKAVWKMPPYSNRSRSVRYLDLRGVDQFGQSQYYSDQQCSSLVRSPLGSQCQHLLIDLEKRSNIIDLVTKMIHLRTLNVRCYDGQRNRDDLIKWLQARLPTTCSFARDSTATCGVRIWLR